MSTDLDIYNKKMFDEIKHIDEDENEDAEDLLNPLN